MPWFFWLAWVIDLLCENSDLFEINIKIQYLWTLISDTSPLTFTNQCMASMWMPHDTKHLPKYPCRSIKNKCNECGDAKLHAECNYDETEFEEALQITKMYLGQFWWQASSSLHWSRASTPGPSHQCWGDRFSSWRWSWGAWKGIQ